MGHSLCVSQGLAQQPVTQPSSALPQIDPRPDAFARAQGPAPAPPLLGGDALQKPGVPVGKLSAPLTLSSVAYDGMVSRYWIYVPAQYDPQKPAAVMIFQDGEGYLNRAGDHPALNVIDNLIAQGKIPVMIAVFVNPMEIATGSPDTPTYKFVEAYGKRWGRTLQDSMRSVEYDTVSDRYPLFLRNELIPEVSRHYNLRKDAYSHAITGSSSGGICAFNAAWQMPDTFSRVISWIGSFTGIQWRDDPAISDGGQDYPDKILHEAHRNVRVLLQDGSNDLEWTYGSWPMANIRMANALKSKGYDFRFSFGQGRHSSAWGGAEFADEMTWLWRGYDPNKTEDTFLQEASEASKPPFRVTIVNR